MAYELKPDETRHNLMWLLFENTLGWAEFNSAIASLAAYAADAQSSFYLIIQPGQDIPSGNPLPHMRRLFDLVKQEDKIRKVFVILSPGQPLARTFANIGQKVFGLEDYIQVVITEEAALAAFQSVT